MRRFFESLHPADVGHSLFSGRDLPGEGGPSAVSLAQFEDASRRRKRLTVTVREPSRHTDSTSA
jgi:hypothetical protein